MSVQLYLIRGGNLLPAMQRSREDSALASLVCEEALKEMLEEQLPPMIGPTIQPVETWWRRCNIISMHDGDTMEVMVDLGFAATVQFKLRLKGVNAPELHVPGGEEAHIFAEQWWATHENHATDLEYTFMVQYDGWDNYGGRFDGVLVCAQNHCLNDDLLKSGNAVVYKA